MKWFTSFKHECIYCKILAGITCVALLSIIVYFSHGGWYIEEPKNIIYHYQTLATGLIALFVGWWTVTSVRKQIHQQEKIHTTQKIAIEVAFLNAIKSYTTSINDKAYKLNPYNPNRVYTYFDSIDKSILNAEIPAIVLDWHILAQIRPCKLNVFMEYRKEIIDIKKYIESLNITTDCKLPTEQVTIIFSMLVELIKKNFPCAGGV